MDLGSVHVGGKLQQRDALIIILEPLICERKLTSWDGGRVGP